MGPTHFSPDGLLPMELLAGATKEIHAAEWDSETSVPHSLRLIALDDDPLYCRMLEKAAKRHHIALTACADIGDLHRLLSRDRYDGVLVDYFFGNCKGTDIAATLGAVPTFLMSCSDSWLQRDSRWPKSVVKFLHKRNGADAVLEEAVKLLDGVENFYREPAEEAEEATLDLPRVVMFRLAATVALIATFMICRATVRTHFPPAVKAPLHWDAAPVPLTRGMSEISPPSPGVMGYVATQDWRKRC